MVAWTIRLGSLIPSILLLEHTYHSITYTRAGCFSGRPYLQRIITLNAFA